VRRIRFCGGVERDVGLGHSQYRERFYERAVKKKVFLMPPIVLGS